MPITLFPRALQDVKNPGKLHEASRPYSEAVQTPEHRHHLIIRPPFIDLTGSMFVELIKQKGPSFVSPLARQPPYSKHSLILSLII